MHQAQQCQPKNGNQRVSQAIQLQRISIPLTPIPASPQIGTDDDDTDFDQESSTRYKSLDETGIIGAVCKHEFPQRFFSFRHGERFVMQFVLFSLLL